MMHMFVVISFIILGVYAEDPVSVVKSLSIHIGNVIIECQEEMKFPEVVINEFLKFWDTAHVLNLKLQGCAAACLMEKLELATSNGQVIKDNMNAFMSANGAGPQVTKTMTDLLEICISSGVERTRAGNSEDGCIMALEMLKCFRYGLFSLNWAPEFGVDYRDEINAATIEDAYK